ncbi:MAG: hypothetical protein JO189_10900 [Deltaproteobacteria bacterium]|nr:hypothetical protein [Deltaproteobacteria bacterium]
MTIERRDLSNSYLSLAGMLWIAMIIIVLGAAGCAPAMIAPLAMQAGELAGVGALNAAGYARGNAPLDVTVDPAEREERCDELQLEVPGTIEFRMADNNPTAWRELRLGGSTDAPRWQAVANEQSDAAGWRPLVNLHTMSFAPPLQPALRSGKPNYLAFAPAEPRTSVERDQLVALTADFGTGLGTFQWNGREYQYTLVNRLPCFPGPAVVAGQTRG